MSLTGCGRVSPLALHRGLVVLRVLPRVRGLTPKVWSAAKSYLQAAGTILFFSAIMVVLLGTKAAVVLSRMHG
jgi:hypothetical protein